MRPPNTWRARRRAALPRRRRLFLPLAVGRPGGGLRVLSRVKDDVARLGRVLGARGYRRGVMPRDMSAAELRESLDRWLTQARLGPKDDLVVYYTGHGHVAEGEHYLCMAGFDPDRVASTGFKTSDLIDLILRRRYRPGKLWLILDCCQAGAALTGALLRGVDTSSTATFILAASASWGAATDGAFARELEDAVGPDAGRTETRLSLGDVTERVNARRRLHAAVSASLATKRFDLLDRP